jgi:hypothetical protein
VSALEGKRKVAFFFHQNPGQRLGIVSLIGFEDIAGLGVLHDTVYLAETAIHAVFFAD